jgi:hypothetical protein
MLKRNYIQAQIISDGDMPLNTIQYSLEPGPILFFLPIHCNFPNVINTEPVEQNREAGQNPPRVVAP